MATEHSRHLKGTSPARRIRGRHMVYLRTCEPLRKVGHLLFHKPMMTHQRTKMDYMSRINTIEAENRHSDVSPSATGLAQGAKVSRPKSVIKCHQKQRLNQLQKSLRISTNSLPMKLETCAGCKSLCKSLTFAPPNRMDDERHLRKYIRSILARVSLSSVAKVLKNSSGFFAAFLTKNCRGPRTWLVRCSINSPGVRPRTSGWGLSCASPTRA
jgi:hypothetical protein